ncbi:hypothetical protein [Geodermatophilus sabuli]|uniref:Uncharacterized protein n=1 Tax=Geodermatophilus sabuli TaxID=1564158 RepID=A0A285EBJ3_9ACTN|nr:hypothetical protein [Geodermatophilus sabuli]MBB3084385.1 hypothetical protein [Geodermatophilus sabuli]SNX96347.1 hypothetical protein SAMN06893097_10461 [Geodermatophilus sabuli]
MSHGSTEVLPVTGSLTPRGRHGRLPAAGRPGGHGVAVLVESV